MHTELEKLCALLDDELERQELMVALLQSQHDAILARDVDYLNTKTRAMEAVLKESAEAEKERHTVLRVIVDHYTLSVERQTLTELIRVTPDPFSRRLKDTQRRIQETMADAKRLTQENHRLLRASSSVVTSCLNRLFGNDLQEGREYTRKGQDSGAFPAPALLDRQG